MKLKIKTRILKRDPNLYYYVLLDTFNDIIISNKDNYNRLAYLVSDTEIKEKKWSELVNAHSIEM